MTRHDSNNGRLAGEKLRDEAFQQIEEARALDVLRIRHAFLEMLLHVGESTSDPIANALPLRLRMRTLGAAIGGLSSMKLIEKTGYTQSTRPERHGGDTKIWALADCEAAEQWLRDNPLPADPKPIEPKPEPPAGRTGLSLFDFLHDTKEK